MSSAFSPTGYWARYSIRIEDEHGAPIDQWVDTWPIVDVVGDNPRVIFDDGTVYTLRALLTRLRKNSVADGETRRVFLTVTTDAPEDGR